MGAVMSDVKNQQIKNIPEDITHIALSIGGNDLLGLIQYLDQNRGDSFHQNLQFLSQLKQKFSEEYSEVIQTIDTLGIPFSVCTIYYAGPTEESGAKRVDVKGDIGLSGTDVVVDAFDSAIIDVANKAQNCKDIIDLRWLFDDHRLLCESYRAQLHWRGADCKESNQQFEVINIAREEQDSAE